MAGEMLNGLLNQTSGGKWWGGQAAQNAPTTQSSPTSGYGSMPSVQASVAETPAGTPTTPATTTAAPTTSPPTPAANPNQGRIDMLQRQLVAAQNQLSNAMANVTKDMSTGMPKPSFNDNAKINRAKHEIQRLQGELRAAQLKAQQGGY